MSEYHRPTDRSRGDVSTVFEGMDSLYHASSLPAPLFRVTLAAAAAREILIENPMPFPGAETSGDIAERDTPAGDAARAAIHNLMRQDVSKYGNVAIMTGTIMANMHAQCYAQQLLRATDQPEYRDSLNENGQKLVAFIVGDPAERTEMEHQANGEFHLMKDQNQRELLGDSISATLLFMSSHQNFTAKLDGIAQAYEHDEKANYTPSVYAQAAKEGRLNDDETIRPAAGQQAQPVYQAHTAGQMQAQAAGMGR